MVCVTNNQVCEYTSDGKFSGFQDQVWDHQAGFEVIRDIQRPVQGQYAWVEDCWVRAAMGWLSWAVAKLCSFLEVLSFKDKVHIV